MSPHTRISPKTIEAEFLRTRKLDDIVADAVDTALFVKAKEVSDWPVVLEVNDICCRCRFKDPFAMTMGELHVCIMRLYNTDEWTVVLQRLGGYAFSVKA